MTLWHHRLGIVPRVPFFELNANPALFAARSNQLSCLRAAVFFCRTLLVVWISGERGFGGDCRVVVRAETETFIRMLAEERRADSLCKFHGWIIMTHATGTVSQIRSINSLNRMEEKFASVKRWII